MAANDIALVQTIAIFLALFGFWWRLDRKIDAVDAKLSGEIKEVRLASEAAHKEINGKLNAIEITQATHSERFNTVDERFNTVDARLNATDKRLDSMQDQMNRVEDKVDKLGGG